MFTIITLLHPYIDNITLKWGRSTHAPNVGYSVHFQTSQIVRTALLTLNSNLTLFEHHALMME